MQYGNLVPVLKTNILNLARMWMQEIKKSEYMVTYQALSEGELQKRGEAVFTNLIKWLDYGASNEDVKNYFEAVGSIRNDEGFPLSEVNYALYLVKKVFWCFSAWKEEIVGNMDSKQLIEFTTILNNYFDLGDFFIIRGYLNKLFKKLNETDKFSKAELEKLLIKGPGGKVDFSKC